LNKRCHHSYAALVMIAFFVFGGNEKVPAQAVVSNVRILFHHMVGDQQLEFETKYRNTLGEQFTVRKFRYYISNIEFSDTVSGKFYRAKDQYFLVNEAEPGSKIIALELPAGVYNKVSFLVGVDSLKNVSGAQSGALDPLNDMFWTWKSGYVMAKLEGQSPASTLPHRVFEYHIGGFGGVHNVLGRVALTLPVTVNIPAQKMEDVQIAADVGKWFSGTYQLSIARYPACTSVGVLAKQFSENYLRMFAIQSVAP